jgi:LysM repeat protein
MLASALVAGAMVAVSNESANADTTIDQNTVRVDANDTLSEIAEHHHTTVAQLVKDNHIANQNLIHVGDKLVVTPGAKATQPAQPSIQVASNNNQGQQVAQTTNSSLTGNSMAALRRSIESGGNYNTNTGNGYLGAYQFAPQTIAGIESATGMKWSMDPATQDAFANYYANSRYGGWAHVPTNGAW